MNYNYDFDIPAFTTGIAGGIMAILLAFIGIIVLLCLIFVILQTIGKWKIFTKAGQPGWPALIPFYNDYIMCTITGVSPWWLLIVFIIAPACNIIPILGSLLSLAIVIYYSILLNVSLARSYGKEDAWAIGFILLQPFFLFALGIGKSKYQGAKPMNDIVLEKLGILKKEDTQNNTTGNMNEQSKQQFCPYCGTQVLGDSKYCINCGKEL